MSLAQMSAQSAFTGASQNRPYHVFARAAGQTYSSMRSAFDGSSKSGSCTIKPRKSDASESKAPHMLRGLGL